MVAEYHFSLHHHFVSFPIFLIITISFYIKLPRAKEKLLLNICICDENIKVRIYFQAKGEDNRLLCPVLRSDVCVGLLLALDQDSRGDHKSSIFYSLTVIFQVLSIIVFDPFTELFITLCIVVNVLFMSADHYDVEYDGM